MTLHILRSLIEYFQGLINAMETSDLAFGALVLLANLVILIFSRRIATFFAPPGESAAKSKARLRFMNLLLFCLYFIPIFLPEVVSKISETSLVLLIAYGTLHIFRLLMRQKFGREKDVEGERIITDSYQSEMFSLLMLLGIMLGAFLIIVNIWEITDWLKTTSLVGGCLLVAYSTKDVWAPENIHGLIMLYSGNVEPGSVVKVDEFNLLAVVKEIKLTEMIFRDLRHRHTIVLPNSRFRNAKVEILTSATGRGLVDYVDFKLGYGIPGKDIEAFLIEIWERAKSTDSGIEASVKPRVALLENGDHAACWRLSYNVGNVYRLLNVRFAINRAAYDLSLERGIGLDTPFTHSGIVNEGRKQQDASSTGSIEEKTP